MATILPEDAAAMAVNPTKKGGKRKPLKNLSANISAGAVASAPPLHSSIPNKENREGLSLLLSPVKTSKRTTKPKAPKKSSAAASADMEELLGRFERLRLEKERAEVLLREREELLKQKDEEIEVQGKEKEKLRIEVKKLQKIKGFNPTMTMPTIQSLREKEEAKEESKKKSKDCQETKRPCPAYVLYSKDQWNEIKKENPEATFKEISNAVGAKWKNLSAEEKKPYEDKYQQDKEAYLKVVGKEKREKEAMKLLEEEHMQKTAMELLEQYLQFKQEADKGTSKPKKEKDPLKPKHPMSAFFLYANERRAALLAENRNLLEVSKVMGEEWKKMSEEMKAPYEEIAKKQKEEYLQQMEVYKQKKSEEAENLQKEEEEQKKILKQEALQLLKKKEKTENIINKTKEIRQKKKQEKNSDPNKPKKPASSFLLFSKEARKSLMQERPDIQASTLNALISVKWKELSDTEKQIWNEKASEAMTTYKKELEEYNKSVVAQEKVVRQ